MMRLLVLAALAFGCYNPQIGEAQYTCKESGLCPNGFACNMCGECVTKGKETRECQCGNKPDGTECWFCGERMVPGRGKVVGAVKSTCAGGACKEPGLLMGLMAMECKDQMCCIERGMPVCRASCQ
jgi:hypothetical protein